MSPEERNARLKATKAEFKAKFTPAQYRLFKVLSSLAGIAILAVIISIIFSPSEKTVDLHNCTIADWRKATIDDKTITCGDWLTMAQLHSDMEVNKIFAETMDSITAKALPSDSIKNYASAFMMLYKMNLHR